jgi:hypothetical protein
MDVREYLFRRKNRTVGKLLDYCEREVFPHIGEERSSDARATIKRMLGDYHRDVLDLVGESPVRVNAAAVEARERIHDHHHPRT